LLYEIAANDWEEAEEASGVLLKPVHPLSSEGLAILSLSLAHHAESYVWPRQ